MKPLTIEQLKKLEVGDWVWIVSLEKNVGVYSKIEEYIDPITMRQFTQLKGLRGLSYDNYGKKWLAYKNKEQAEAKGEIVELPCGVGDAVYTIGNAKIAEEKVLEIYIDADSTIFTIGKVYDGVNSFKSYARYYLEQHNKTWFTDKSEAERRLAELKGE